MHQPRLRDENDRQLIGPQADKFDVFQAGHGEFWPEYDSSLPTELGQNPRSPTQQFRDIPLGFLEGFADEGPFFFLQFLEFHDGVKIKTQSSVCWNAPGRGVRLEEQSKIFKVSHDVTDRS